MARPWRSEVVVSSISWMTSGKVAAVLSTAPPASYEVEGRQFIVVPVTGGGKLGGPTGDAWMAFALPK